MEVKSRMSVTPHTKRRAQRLAFIKKRYYEVVLRPRQAIEPEGADVPVVEEDEFDDLMP